ncbi:MAG: aldo/keto reductase [Anaerolineae bacterium]
MRTFELGTTGVEVSAFCLGAMFFGSRTKPEASYAILDQYVAAGGRFIDTANIYAHWVDGCEGGESETLLGEWMRRRGNRHELILASKVGFPAPVDDLEQGLRAEQIERAVEGSLTRLGVETIDLYYAHVDDRTTPLAETMEAFHRLVTAGKVRWLGASNFLAWRMAKANALAEAEGWTPYCCIQQRYSYLRPRPGASFGAQIAVNDDLLDYCASEDVTLLAYSPLLSGAYTREERDFDQQYQWPDQAPRLKALYDVAGELGATANQVILAWMVQSDPPVIPLVAGSTTDQMAENLAALELKLSAEHMQRLNDAGL